MTHKLIADVGGTNIRLATVTDTGITDIEKYQCGEFVSIQAAIESKLFDKIIVSTDDEQILFSQPITIGAYLF